LTNVLLTWTKGAAEEAVVPSTVFPLNEPIVIVAPRLKLLPYTLMDPLGSIPYILDEGATDVI
jgi:hypothetical protein